MDYKRFRIDRDGNQTEQTITMTQEDENRHNQRTRIRDFLQADNTSITLLQLVRAFKAYLRLERNE